MKRGTFIWIVVCLSFLAFAQERQGAFNLGVVEGYGFSLKGRTLHDTDFWGLHLGFNFGDKSATELSYAFMEAEEGDLNFFSLDYLYYLHPERKAVPYVLFGAGLLDFDEAGPTPSQQDFLLSVGLGMKYSLCDYSSIRGDVRNIVSGEDPIHAGITFRIGLNLQFGGTPRPPEPPLPALDRDNDGVRDSIDYCWDTPQKVTVDKRGCPIDTDGDGTPDYQEDDDGDGVINYYDLSPNTPAGYPVNEKGEPLDSDGDGLYDGREKELGTDVQKADTDGDGLSDGDEVNTYKTDPLKADTDGDGLSDGDEVNTYKTDPLKADTDGDGYIDGDEVNTYKSNPLVAGDVVQEEIESKMIHFDFDKYNIRPDAQPILDDIAQTLLKASSIHLLLKGHCDWIGPRWYNNKLGLKRAESAKKYLVQKGISADRLETKSFGEDQPIADNHTKEGRAKNRRVEFEVKKP